MIIRVDMESGVPVWRQITDQFRALFVSGKVKPGERIATVRELAIDLGVNHNTVAEAYRALAEQGFLRLERGVGAIVLQRSAPRAKSGEHERFLLKLRALLAEAEAAGVSADSLIRKVTP